MVDHRVGLCDLAQAGGAPLTRAGFSQPVAGRRLGAVLAVQRSAVLQLPEAVAKTRIVGFQFRRAPVHQFYRIGAREGGQRPLVQINADQPQRRRLALHQAAAAQMRLNIDRMGRLHRQQRLAQPGSRLAAKIAHSFAPQ